MCIVGTGLDVERLRSSGVLYCRHILHHTFAAHSIDCSIYRLIAISSPAIRIGTATSVATQAILNLTTLSIFSPTTTALRDGVSRRRVLSSGLRLQVSQCPAQEYTYGICATGVLQRFRILENPCRRRRRSSGTSSTHTQSQIARRAYTWVAQMVAIYHINVSRLRSRCLPRASSHFFRS